MAGEIPLLVIVGPTASGKSALAMELARSCGAEILSVDSMQVYQGMDIGTAKPTQRQRREIPHHLLDRVRPDEQFSAARFVEMADRVIEESNARGAKLIATGGTPMYFKALFEGLFEGPSADEALRKRLRAMSGPELHERLKQVDAAAAERIHAADSRRLVRALEVYELTGQPISTLQKQWERQQPARHRAVWIGLRWEREALNRRINARVKEMIEAGWVEELRGLLAEFPVLSKTAREATGYAQLVDHVMGRIGLDEAVEQIKIDTRQLARRQMKWFRRFRNVQWLEGQNEIARNAEDARRMWGLAS
ncbi:MAG TPA: tRNA (adenosine(37)-N6)-dimethylallyltransferase MiaA [Tepidisphaeraceae bacterium]|jgi:tRNA dimethylallyltransferase|nr:tRNA (adenosine(37)-N6)-dimethylallyltransferase MiaA [Tepidisphaeraceae bacterium]